MNKLLKWITCAVILPSAALASEAEQRTPTQSRFVETNWQVGTLETNKSIEEIKATIAEQNGVVEHKLKEPRPVVARTDANGKMVIGHGEREDWILTPNKELQP